MLDIANNLSVIVHLVNVPLLKLLQDVIYFALNFAIFSGIQQPNSSLYYISYTFHTCTACETLEYILSIIILLKL